MNFIKVGSQMINLDQVLYMEEVNNKVFMYARGQRLPIFLLRDITLRDIEDAIERATTSNRR